MKAKEKKFLFGIPSWGLALLTAVISLILLIVMASILGAVQNIGEDLGQGIAYIIVDILVAIACFYICKNNPKSIWYAPVLCNIMGILSALIEPDFWTGSLWIVVCIGWILSIIGAISGAMTGKKIN